MKFISKVNSIKDIKKRIYVTATLLSEKILKNVSFIFKYYQVDTEDKTLFTLSFGIYIPRKGKKVVRDAICSDIR